MLASTGRAAGGRAALTRPLRAPPSPKFQKGDRNGAALHRDSSGLRVCLPTGQAPAGHQLPRSALAWPESGGSLSQAETLQRGHAEHQGAWQRTPEGALTGGFVRLGG